MADNCLVYLIMKFLTHSVLHFTDQTDPEFAQALVGNDLDRLQSVLRERLHQKSEMLRKQEEENL